MSQAEERRIGPTTSFNLPAASRIGTLSWAIERLIPLAIPKPASSPATAPQTPEQEQPGGDPPRHRPVPAMYRATSCSLASR